MNVSKDICKKSATELFETQAFETPDLIALKDRDSEFSYKKLNEKANQFARFLEKKGVGEGHFVAILLEPKADFIICMLAIIKLGAIYVPLDTHAPKARLQEIINDSAPKLIITNENYQSYISATKIPIYLINELHIKSSNYNLENIGHKVTAASPIYMIYTSGSVGKPKGVLIPHRAVVNLARVDNIIDIQQNEKTAQYCNLAFDGSIFEIWVALLNGATLCIIPNEARRNHYQLKKVIRDYALKYLLLPTGYFHQLIKSSPDTLDDIFTISFGGEQINANLLKKFINYRKKNNIPTKLINVYGPTEATVFSCCNVINIEQQVSDDQLASIGFKTCNTKTYVIDEKGNLADEGELCVSGIHLALGYHNSLKQTQEKFIKNPFTQIKPFEKIYKTGDRVKKLTTGELLYLGRLDDQVKIGGFRIHLSEIEQALMQHKAISLAAVTVEIGGGSHKILTAYLVFAAKEIIQADEIREFLSETLPPYMLPTKYVMVEKLPLTAVGKIDKLKLDKISHIDLSFHVDTSSSSPIEETIKAIWRNLLNLKTIDSTKNLFDLGANSLLITEACSRINQELKSEIAISDLLGHPTIAKLSRFLEGNIETPAKRKHKKMSSADIAIIGMSCRFPQAKNLHEFWKNLCEGKDCLTRFPEDSSSHSLSANNFVPVKGILGDIDQFDANFFNFSPADAKLTDPQHRIFLECVWEALEHAAIAPQKLESKVISVFAGMTDSTYLQENLLKNRWFCSEYNQFYQRIATSMSMLSTQVSYRLNFTGRSINVNTACSTGLVTIDQACIDLLLGQSDIALAGTSSITVPEKQGYFYQPGSILSLDGYCKPFSDEANGTVFSNGVGVVVLKRLEDAIAERDTIYAVIKGRGVNNDGIDKLGFTAPSTSGQISCIREALIQANIKPEQVGLLEAHGTATALGDLIEIDALNSVYQEQTAKTQFCALGSVKANIGHTDVTAGIASIIKTALCIYHEKIPPLLHYKNPNPNLPLSKSPFFINTQLLDWSTSERYAGVSSFGIGGTNAHLILSGFESKIEVNPSDETKEELIFISAKTEKALKANVSNLKQYLNISEDNLSNVAYTLHTGREDFAWRKFAIGKTVIEVCKDLETQNPQYFNEETHHSIVFMFSGQGTQYPQMAAELFKKLPKFAEYVKLGAKLAKHYLNYDLLPSLLDKTNKIKETQYVQPTLFILEYALAKVLMDCGVKPETLIGHSIGEYVAACLAGVFSFKDGVALVCKRGLLMLKASKGEMLAIEATQQELKQYKKIVNIDISLHNATNNYVVAGDKKNISSLEKHLAASGKFFKKLRVSHAFHSHFMDGLEKPFKDLFTNIKLAPPSIPIVSNVTGDWLSASDATDPNYWYRHLRHTVQFANGINLLLHDKHPLFIEIGPGHSLCAFVKDLSHGKAITTYTIPGHKQETSDMYQFLSTLGTLWSHGVKINLSPIYDFNNCQHIPLSTYSFQRQRYWLEPDNNTILKNNANVLYKWQWSREELITTLPTNSANFEVLIFKNEKDISDQLITLLNHQGIEPIIIEIGEKYEKLSSSYFKINPSEKSDYVRLFSSIKTRLSHPIIFHCLSCSKTNKKALSKKQIDENLLYSFYSHLYLTQALLSIVGTSITINYVTLTTGTQNILGREITYPVKATAVGAHRVIPREHQNILCALFDIDLHENQDTIKQNLIDILNFSTSFKKQSPFIAAYRNKYRWTISYALNQSLPVANYITNNGVYLITGGMGGIGLKICEAIVKTVQNPTFILASRATPIKESEWENIAKTPAHPYNQKIVSILKLIKQGARFIWYQADISVNKDVVKLVNFCIAQFGQLNGLIHAAGIPGGGLLQLKSKCDAEKVLLPKIYGTYYLAKATKKIPLDFVVLMSSIAAITGEKGQVDYCAANTCLDAFANSNLFNTKFITSINWNAWREVGMSVETQRPKDMDLFIRGNDISPSEGQELFIRALSLRSSNLVISNYNLEEYSQYLFEDKTVDAPKENTADRSTFDVSSTYSTPKSESEKKLAALWEKHLHINKIGRDDNFFALGGHSLKALSVIEDINNSLGTHLSIQHLYQAPSISKLSNLINKEEKTHIVVPLKSNDESQPPFFFCHPISGMVYCFNNLVSHWTAPTTLYGLQDPSLSYDTLQFDSILSIAQVYAKEIKKIQPHGPYFLVGYSFGGTIMYEIANIFKQQNEEVGLLGLIEGWCVFSKLHSNKKHFIKSYLSKELQSNKKLANLAWERTKLLLGHMPTKTCQDMLLFKATDLNEDYSAINDPLNGWSKFNTGKITCHAIKSNHDNIIIEGSAAIFEYLMNYRTF